MGEEQQQCTTEFETSGLCNGHQQRCTSGRMLQVKSTALAELWALTDSTAVHTAHTQVRLTADEIMCVCVRVCVRAYLLCAAAFHWLLLICHSLRNFCFCLSCLLVDVGHH